VVLRTIDASYSREGWRKLSYVGDVWSAEYEPVASDHRNQRLRTQFASERVLSEVVLFEGSSLAEPVQRNGERRIRAATFDWYVPVVSPWQRVIGISADQLSVTLAGGSKPRNGPTGGGTSLHLLEGEANLNRTRTYDAVSQLSFGVVDHVSHLGDVLAPDLKLDKAERRHVRLEDVHITWSMSWNAGKLEVIVSGRPDERPFQAMLVVEETVYSGEPAPPSISDILDSAALVEHIHTPFVAELANQLVMVPQEFFVEERKAIDHANKLIAETERRFSESVHPRPGDPVIGVRQQVAQMLIHSESTSTLALALQKRFDFVQEHAPDHLRDVRQVRRETPHLGSRREG
jgi:hypothetical protein